MPTKKQTAQAALTQNKDGQEVITRPTALDFKKVEKLKQLIL